MMPLARLCSLALVIAFGQMAAAPAQAGGSVVISIGQGHSYGYGYGYGRPHYPYGYGYRRPFRRYGHYRPYRYGFFGHLALPPIVLAPALPAPASATLAPSPPLPPRQEYIDRTNCAPYTSEIVIDGQRQVLSGTACEQPDGRWRLID